MKWREFINSSPISAVQAHVRMCVLWEQSAVGPSRGAAQKPQKPEVDSNASHWEMSHTM